MKLMNKKTGEIVEYDSIGFRKGLSNGWEDFIANANSIAELNETWEDYKPVEPLIKNEKVRKAIRAWADAVGADIAYLHIDNEEPSTFFVYNLMFGCNFIQFAFNDKNPIEVERVYTIAELCGDDEE